MFIKFTQNYKELQISVFACSINDCGPSKMYLHGTIIPFLLVLLGLAITVTSTFPSANKIHVIVFETVHGTCPTVSPSEITLTA